MKIGIDIDEVLCEFVKGYLNFLKSGGHADIKFDDVFTYNFEDVLDISQEENWKLINEYNCTDEFYCIDLIPGAKEGVDKLNNKFETFFITARPFHIKAKTEVFLKERFGVGKDRLFFSSDAHGGDLKTKDEYCREFGIDVIIEDNGVHSMNYAKNGLRVVLFDKPWNKGVEHKNIVRVNDWDECLEVIEKMEVGG